MNTFSALNRQQTLQKIDGDFFDLIVIGGGITGAGIALDAATRGMKVGLIEKSDFASGTSSKSTKLIHGGLRYLKQLEFKLVNEVGRERAIVHRLAPHLVHPEKMILPIIEGGTLGKFGTTIGLAVYDFLAGVKGDDRFKIFSKKKTMQEEPLLDTTKLKAGALYAEYRTDDARLTIELLKTAAEHGAVSLNYIRAVDFNYDEAGQLTGVNCKDELSGFEFEINSQHVVSAAGPWVDELRVKDKSKTNKSIFLSKGAHIVVPYERLPIKHTVYFDVPDGRMMFAVRRHRTTYIGTTDTPYKGDRNAIFADNADVQYILDGTNAMFPDVNLTLDDVESTWAGVRPLIFEEGKSGSEMSRKDEIFVGKSGLLSIAGGKLTGYRKMAQRIVDIVAKRAKANGKKFKKCQTKNIALKGGPFANYKAVNDYKTQLAQILAKDGIDEYYADYLVSNFGQQATQIIDKMKDFEGTGEEKLARAELWYTVHHELVFNANDFFNRRTGRIYFNMPSLQALTSVILDDLTNYFDWDASQRAQAQQDLATDIQSVLNFEMA